MIDLRIHIGLKHIRKEVRINPDYPYKSKETYLVEEKKIEQDVCIKFDFKMFILETLKFLLKKEEDKLIKPYEIDYNNINTQIVHDKIHGLLELNEYSKVLEIFENNKIIFEKKNFEDSIIKVFRKEYNKSFSDINECIDYVNSNKK